MSLLINSTTLGNIIITIGSVFSCITSFVNSHGIKLQESLPLVKRKLPQILIVLKMLVKKQKAWHKKRQDELAGARTEAAQIIDGAKETGKTSRIKNHCRST